MEEVRKPSVQKRKKKKKNRIPFAVRLIASVVVCCLMVGFGYIWGNGTLSSMLERKKSYKDGPEITLLVNANHPLPDSYLPDKLVNLYEMPHSFRLAQSDIQVEESVYIAMEKMFKAAEEEGMNGFIVTSGYRTLEQQVELYEQDVDGRAAQPNASEHRTGLAFDVTTQYDTGEFEDTAQFQWLMEHCWDFGFILRYPKNKEDITGIKYESWHYRYVGYKPAQAIKQANCTLEEYLGKN